jgi:hypothetical protein
MEIGSEDVSWCRSVRDQLLEHLLITSLYQGNLVFDMIE